MIYFLYVFLTSRGLLWCTRFGMELFIESPMVGVHELSFSYIKLSFNDQLILEALSSKIPVSIHSTLG